MNEVQTPPPPARRDAAAIAGRAASVHPQHHRVDRVAGVEDRDGEAAAGGQPGMLGLVLGGGLREDDASA